MQALWNDGQDGAGRARPEHFCFSYLVARAVPYRCCTSTERETGTGGVMPVGEVIWLRQTLGPEDRKRVVVGFTERTGIVRVRARDLAELRSTTREVSREATGVSTGV